MKIPTISTERLLLTIPDINIAQKIVTFVTENRAFHEPWDPPRTSEYFTLSYWEKTLQQNIADFSNDHSAKFFIFDQNYEYVIGYCNFSCFIRGVFQCCNLGFAIGQNYQGKGYMYEALTAAISYIFQDLKLHRIQANHLPHNDRSRNLLRRLGFVPEGYARDYLFIYDAWQDHVLNSLTNTKMIAPHENT